MAKTELDRIADAYVDTVVRLSPMTATDIGADGNHAALDDFSPAGHAARAEAVRLPSSDGDGTAQQNIMALVGSAPLREIVAETNDMIEKICIETALRLTGNNRVAAAEMLGLSRQSLYVKLRKFKLLKRTEDE